MCVASCEKSEINEQSICLRLGTDHCGILRWRDVRLGCPESIGGAEIVVNEVKGNLTAGKVVSVLRGDDVYREEGVKTSADSTGELSAPR